MGKSERPKKKKSILFPDEDIYLFLNDKHKIHSQNSYTSLPPATLPNNYRNTIDQLIYSN